MIHEVFALKWPSRSSVYLEDILDLLDLPEVDHDAWGARFCLQFTKIV